MSLVKGLYGSTIQKEKACGYCYYHKCYLTTRMVKSHQCLQKQCNCLKKIKTHEWWKQRDLMKQRKKAKKDIEKLLI